MAIYLDEYLKGFRGSYILLSINGLDTCIMTKTQLEDKYNTNNKLVDYHYPVYDEESKTVITKVNVLWNGGKL